MEATNNRLVLGASCLLKDVRDGRMAVHGNERAHNAILTAYMCENIRSDSLEVGCNRLTGCPVRKSGVP